MDIREIGAEGINLGNRKFLLITHQQIRRIAVAGDKFSVGGNVEKARRIDQDIIPQGGPFLGSVSNFARDRKMLLVNANGQRR